MVQRGSASDLARRGFSSEPFLSLRTTSHCLAAELFAAKSFFRILVEESEDTEGMKNLHQMPQIPELKDSRKFRSSQCSGLNAGPQDRMMRFHVGSDFPPPRL